MKCSDCYSIKALSDEGDGKCARCYGTGAAGFIDSAIESFNILNDERPKCTTCRGTGICQTCGGTGTVQDTRVPKEPEARPSTPSSTSSDDSGFSCLLWLGGLVAAMLVVLFSILTVIVTIPVWVGATAVSVITAYAYSRKILVSTSAEVLAAAPLLQIQRRKRMKLRVAPAFLKEQIRWNPHLLITTGSGLLYAAASAGLLVLVNADQIVRVMYGVALVAGTILAWKTGKKMLEWRISEAVFAARRLPATGLTTASQLAFGLACVASAIFLVLLIVAAVNLPNDLRRRQTQLAARSKLPTSTGPERITSSPPATVSRESNVRRPTQTQSFAPRPESRSTPTQSVPPSSPGDPVRVFTERFLDTETRGSVADLVAMYAPTVSYFDNGQADHGFIEKDKQDYDSRWIKRTQNRTGNIQVSQFGAAWTATYPTHFRVENVKGDWIEGDADNSLQIAPNGSSFHITGQQVQVKNRVKGNSTFSAQSGAVSADAISAFITQLMELEKSQQLDSILSKYASRVAYFDNGIVDQAFIRKDKADYFARWPSISYALNGAINATQLGSNTWEVRAPTKFHVTNQRGEWIDGDVTQALTIDTSGPSWLITAEKGEVTRREKGSGPPQTERSTNTASTGSSQAIGGGAFRGKGTVYKIPDLKNLAGKQLSNAWLYGEFAFEQQQGNVAVCRTAATVFFVGKGTTKVNIEFAGGFSVSERILASMRDPQLPLTFTLRTAPNNPMRLLRVRQNRDGTLEAFARSPIRLEMQ